MGRIVAALDDLDRRTLRARTHPLVGPASLHCAKIDGGVGLSTYAPACTLTVERRTLPGESPEGALEEIRSAIAGAGEEADLSVIFSRPPLTCDPQAKVARAAREAIQAVHGAPAEEAGVPYWMDAAVFGQAGIPAVDYGPTGFGAHEAVEWVDLDSVVRTGRVLAETARRFTAGPPD
jgi:acetylornithine deacetylase